jgi:hypothetical protein
MIPSLIAGLFHVVRVALAALVMVALTLALWVFAGITSLIFGVRAPSVVVAVMIAIMSIAFAGGGYLSARDITPRSIVHPALGAVAVAMLFEWIFTTGDLGLLAIGLPASAAVLAAGGAALARRSANKVKDQ